MTCPSSCSQRGTCQSMKYYATQKDEGEGTVYTYENQWDAEMMYGCACTSGFFGPDCSLRECPTGDDPLTGTTSDTQQYNEKQSLYCIATGGSFTLAFRRVTTDYIPYDASLSELRSYLRALSSVTDEGISITGSDPPCKSAGGTVYIEFTQDFGDLPLLVADYSGLSHSTSTAKVTIKEYKKGTKEDEWCSNRGICDFDSGVCTCNDDYGTSDGYNGEGTRGDCGYVTATNDDPIIDCPGEFACSLMGVCDDEDDKYRCSCVDGWTGSDCSLRTCPYGRSWFSRPTADDEAHLGTAECSDMGVCDQEEGVCTCSAGFVGAACQYLWCATDELGECNNNGQCLSMADLAEQATTNGVRQDYTYGAVPNDPATWDAGMVHGCLCDAGWTGYDCSLRLCPFGDDPSTTGDVNEVQSLSCAGSSGGFQLTFREATTETIAYDATAAELEGYLEALDTVEDVSVNITSGSSVCGATAVTTFIEFYMPTSDVPLIEVEDGYDVDSISLTEKTKGTKEYQECSGRGLCDRSLGECTCFSGYGSSDGQGGAGERDDCGFLIADFGTTDTG